jgi:phosphoribosyl-ATP pyrophosphohydrolase/phosphoribosyl-AMP cyclohydrolase/histidinol dehydrogenase
LIFDYFNFFVFAGCSKVPHVQTKKTDTRTNTNTHTCSVQRLIRIDADCDADALRFRVGASGSSSGEFCHRPGSQTCFGADGEMHGVAKLFETVASRRAAAPPGSYTARLFSDRAMLNAKVLEEAGELVEDGQTREHVAFEAADLLYFVAAVCAREGVSLEDVEASLATKARKVTRRPGNVKPPKE